MRKKLALVLVLVTLAITATACGGEDRNSDEVQETNQDIAGMI